jgi:hypothetical protein
MSNWKLTGKQRLRHQLSAVGNTQLVLQVEEESLQTEWLGGYASSDFYKRWRDAVVEDISVGVCAE